MKPIPTVATNRRAHDRFPLRTDVLLQLSDGRQARARSLDMGKGGMGIVTDINALVGTKLNLQLRLPVGTGGSELFQASAVVANVVLAGSDGGFRLGLQFLELSAQAREVLGHFASR